MIHTLAISGYRSLTGLILPLDRLTVVTGRNGTGKSSFYRALRLLAEVAQGRVTAALAAEGGLQSTLWAGPERISRAMREGSQPIEGTPRRGRVALRLGFAADDYGYAIDLGLPSMTGSMFALDPEIKAEAVWFGQELSPRSVIASRKGASVTGTDGGGRRNVPITEILPHESMMMRAADPRTLPELLILRERMRAWRFYDHFRTDPEAPARAARVGTRTPALAPDGGDLAAALQTIREIGDAAGLDAAIADAFPGSRLEIGETGGRLEVLLHQHGLLRPLRASELSDGTLRYLLLLAALMTPRPPGLIVLNEPETSLHPELLAPLARLIAAAASTCQVLAVTHAGELADGLAEEGALAHELTKSFGQTTVEGIETPRWNWPGR